MHLGLLKRIAKELTQIIFALFSFLVYYMICYYYSYKALFIFGITMMVGIFIVLFVMIERGFYTGNE